MESKNLSFKRKLYLALECDTGSKFGYKINFYLSMLIIFSVFMNALATVKPLYAKYVDVFVIIEYTIVVAFIIEYVTRLYVINASKKYKGKILGRLRYALTPVALLDLTVIIVSMLALEHSGIAAIRLLRFLKIARLIKVASKTTTVHIFKTVIHKEKHILILILTFCIALVLISSSIVYIIEHTVQPEVFSSIPKAMWWSIITFTTVGYGDMYPITTLGRILTSIIALIGLACFSIPTAVITAGFINESRKIRKLEEDKENEGSKKYSNNFCRNCGCKLHTENED